MVACPVYLEQLLAESLVEDRLHLGAILHQAVDHVSRDGPLAMAGQVVVDKLSGTVEDVAKDDVVYLLLVVVSLAQLAHGGIIEHERTTEVAVYGRWRQRLYVAQPPGHRLGLRYRHTHDGRHVLPRLQGEPADMLCLSAFHHELQHEPAHLSLPAIVGGVVEGHSHIGGALQERVEIIGIDGHLVFYCRHLITPSQRVRNERRVVDAFGHVALVAGEHEHVVEVEVAGLQHAHDLYAKRRLAMERHRGGVDEL